MGPLILITVCVCIDGCISCCCREPRSETEEWDAAVELAVQQARRTLAAAEQHRSFAAAAPGVAVEQTGTLATAAAAPVAAVEQTMRLVAKKELGYFPYAGAVEAAGQRLVCGICLEEFVRWAACSEVPACRHVFHRDCIGAWMKNSKSTCPLCRALIVPGSERLSAAEDMV
nr:E3 ubiquitin-protein ligase Os03g0188200-like [Lolium perenne]